MVFCVSLLAHVDHGSDAVALLHGLKGVVHLAQSLPVGDELINLEVALDVVLHETGQLRATLDTAERATLPDTTGDELERCFWNVVSLCCYNTARMY